MDQCAVECRRYRSGLERSAVGGAGFGIERFRPVRQEITVGFKMRVELDKALGRTATGKHRATQIISSQLRFCRPPILDALLSSAHTHRHL